MYNHLQHKKHGRNVSKQIKSLSTICGEVLGLSLSKVCLLISHSIQLCFIVCVQMRKQAVVVERLLEQVTSLNNLHSGIWSI